MTVDSTTRRPGAFARVLRTFSGRWGPSEKRRERSSEVIREGLRLLRERDQRVEALRRDVRAGFEAVERGEFSGTDESNIQELAERIKTHGRKCLAEEELKPGTR